MLGLGCALLSLIFPGLKFLWVWSLHKMKELLSSFYFHTVPEILPAVDHSKDQQNRCCQHHLTGSRSLHQSINRTDVASIILKLTEWAMGARQHRLLLWKSIKVSHLYLSCILWTYIAATIKVPSYIFLWLLLKGKVNPWIFISKKKRPIMYLWWLTKEIF